MSLMRRFGLPGVLLGLLGCTADGLAPAAFRGEPLRALCFFDGDGSLVNRLNVRIGLFWVTDPTAHVSVETLAEAPEASRGAVLHTDFIIPIYATPDEWVRDWGTGGEVAIALAIAYADGNGDHRLQPEEEVIALTTEFLVLYAPHDVEAAHSPSTRPLHAGFNVVRGPLSCGLQPEVTPGDCGVQLSTACASDADCGLGACTSVGATAGEPPECTVIAAPDTPCHPSDGLLIYRRQVERPEAYGYYGKACLTDADCPNPRHICRVEAGYCGEDIDPLFTRRRLPPSVCAGPGWMVM
ncbi:MAG: hypothetical protein KC620_26360, partial [Myxococcales bacterium]|nr:hypothetical protein [Myxococcales bacterium]